MTEKRRSYRDLARSDLKDLKEGARIIKSAGINGD
jgi:hypothetical protein